MEALCEKTEGMILSIVLQINQKMPRHNHHQQGCINATTKLANKQNIPIL
jgi:hypothetical protein